MTSPETSYNRSPYLRQLRPSLALVLPAVITYMALGLVLSYALIEFKGEVLLLSSWLGLSDALLKHYNAVLLGVWAACSVKPIWEALVILTTRYDVTDEMLYYTRGVFNSRRDQIELARIRDLSTARPFLLRLVGLGHVQVDSVDTTHPQLSLRGMRDVISLKAWLHSLNVKERQRTGYREIGSAYAIPDDA